VVYGLIRYNWEDNTDHYSIRASPVDDGKLNWQFNASNGRKPLIEILKDIGGFEVILRLEGVKLRSISKPSSKSLYHFRSYRPKLNVNSQKPPTKDIQEIKDCIKLHVENTQDIIKGIDLQLKGCSISITIQISFLVPDLRPRRS
jgi:hypothetical protein